MTKTHLPPLEEYQNYLEQIWNSAHLTNQGPLLLEFENRAKQYLGVNNFHFVGNGTLAIQIALRSLDITEGEVITTPFSYVATTSAILWERCEPVFVDIEPETFCIDAKKIEDAITPRTKAIMPVHVFGNACDVEKIEAIAKEHSLKVIFDAAHAFGVEHEGRSLLDHGDISIGSFHATKLFHTIEGGCVIPRDKAVSDKVELIKRFGHHVDDHYMLGINAKASEFQAAMGLCNLKYVDGLIEKRSKAFKIYNELLGDSFKTPSLGKATRHNYGYYPLLLKSEEQLLKVTLELSEEGIFPRRYFYPSLNTLPYLSEKQSCPVSEDIAKRILCLPLYPDLKKEDIETICKILKKSL